MIPTNSEWRFLLTRSAWTLSVIGLTAFMAPVSLRTVCESSFWVMLLSSYSWDLAPRVWQFKRSRGVATFTISLRSLVFRLIPQLIVVSITLLLNRKGFSIPVLLLTQFVFVSAWSVMCFRLLNAAPLAFMACIVSVSLVNPVRDWPLDGENLQWILPSISNLFLAVGAVFVDNYIISRGQPLI